MTDFTPISWLEITSRLAIATLIGAVIGWDREYSRKAAGLRTNMLVSLGSALFILIPIQSGVASNDASVLGRSLQGIVTGVGFVGAGSIFREDRVRGLTSAAAIWISAGLGLSAGVGLWQLGLIGLGFAIVILRLVKWFESRAGR